MRFPWELIGLIVFAVVVALLVFVVLPATDDGAYDWPAVVATIHPDDPYAGQYISLDEAHAIIDPIATQYPQATCPPGSELC